MSIDEFVFVCVGDTTVLFDSLGGVVGDMLRYKNLPAPVFGGTNFPITTKNIKMVMEEIKVRYPEKKVVVVDCTCVSDNSLLKRSGESKTTESLESFDYIKRDFIDQKIILKKGKVNIVNINYECGDYNILCETFYSFKNKIFSINFRDILLLSNKIINEIFKIFKV